MESFHDHLKFLNVNMSISSTYRGRPILIYPIFNGFTDNLNHINNGLLVSLSYSNIRYDV